MWIKITLVLAWSVTYLTMVASFYAFSHLVVTLKQMNLRNKTILSKYYNEITKTHDLLIKKIRNNKKIDEKELNTFLSLLLITDHKKPKKLKITKNVNKDVMINQIRSINKPNRDIKVSKELSLNLWLTNILERKITLGTKEEKVILISLAIYTFFPQKGLIGIDQEIHPLIIEIFLEDKKKEIN